MKITANLLIIILIISLPLQAYALNDEQKKKLLNLHSVEKWKNTPESQRLETVSWAYSIMKKGQVEKSESLSRAPAIEKCVLQEADEIKKEARFDVLSLVTICYFKLGYGE